MTSTYTRLFESLGFPLLDRANGTSITTKLRQLLEWEHLDRDEMRRRQEEKLGRVLERARAGSAFYRRFWQEHGAGPSSHLPLLDGVPVVTKDDLKQARDDFPEPGVSGRVLECPTSGSTGSPMVFYRSLEQESWFWALRFRIWRWAGYRPGDPYLTINLNPRLGWKKRLQDRLFRCAYLTFNTDNQDSRMLVDTLRRRRIPHLNGFSSSLYVLARTMLDHDLRAPGVRGVTATGDTLFPPFREAVEEAFGVRVLDYYGAGGEGVHLASQCPESGGRYHLHPENAITEFLGDDGPVAPGTSGRIVLTQLDNDAMPLIRYELGDMAAPAPEDATCPCGRTLPMMERVEGRVYDLIAVPDGTYLVPHFFVVLFKTLHASIYRYQIVQEREGHMLVRMVPREDCRRPEVEDAVRREVAAATRDSLELEFDWVGEIPLSGAGKRRLVISEVSRRRIGAPASEASWQR